jgi:hypothetical protein
VIQKHKILALDSEERLLYSKINKVWSYHRGTITQTVESITLDYGSQKYKLRKLDLKNKPNTENTKHWRDRLVRNRNSLIYRSITYTTNNALRYFG